MFGNRKLKMEIAVLFNENDTLRERITGLKADIKVLVESRDKAQAELRALRENYTDASKEVEELKKKVREQNEADLLFASLGIIVSVINGKKKKELGSLVDNQNRLMQQVHGPYFNQQGGGLSDLFYSLRL